MLFALFILDGMLECMISGVAMVQVIKVGSN